MSAAEGMLSAPIATSWAWAAFSRASKARPIAPVSSGFSSSSESALPRRSSVVPPRRSRKLLATLPASDMLRSRSRFVSRAAHPLACRPLAVQQGYGEAMPAQLFVFLQMEFPWALGPADGRYLLRDGPDGRPERVVVLDTLAAGRSRACPSRPGRPAGCDADREPPGSATRARSRRRSRRPG